MRDELQGEIGARRGTVLIVDDAPFLRKQIADIVNSVGLEVVGEAATGLEAVERYRELRPDLVTMDIVMPDMGGVDAIREIRELDASARILVCGGAGQEARVAQALRFGAGEFVPKPYRAARVIEAIRRALG